MSYEMSGKWPNQVGTLEEDIRQGRSHLGMVLSLAWTLKLFEVQTQTPALA